MRCDLIQSLAVKRLCPDKFKVLEFEEMCPASCILFFFSKRLPSIHPSLFPILARAYPCCHEAIKPDS